MLQHVLSRNVCQGTRSSTMTFLGYPQASTRFSTSFFNQVQQVRGRAFEGVGRYRRWCFRRTKPRFSSLMVRNLGKRTGQRRQTRGALYKLVNQRTHFSGILYWGVSPSESISFCASNHVDYGPACLVLSLSLSALSRLSFSLSLSLSVSFLLAC